mgnify:CR=1 FL=1
MTSPKSTHGLKYNFLDTLVFSFYGAMVLGDKDHKKRDKWISRIDKELITAITAATSGEARHIVYKARVVLVRNIHRALDAVDGKDLANNLSNLCLPRWLLALDNYGISNRDKGSKIIRETFGPNNEDVLRRVRLLFLLQSYNSYAADSSRSDFGGPLWAYAAQLALDRQRGRISAIEFIDRCFDLQHNGAMLLDKTHRISDTLVLWLSQKNTAPDEWIARWTPNNIREDFGLPPATPLPLFSVYLVDHALIPPDNCGVLGADWLVDNSVELQKKLDESRVKDRRRNSNADLYRMAVKVLRISEGARRFGRNEGDEDEQNEKQNGNCCADDTECLCCGYAVSDCICGETEGQLEHVIGGCEPCQEFGCNCAFQTASTTKGWVDTVTRADLPT